MHINHLFYFFYVWFYVFVGLCIAISTYVYIYIHINVSMVNVYCYLAISIHDGLICFVGFDVLVWIFKQPVNVNLITGWIFNDVFVGYKCL